MSVKNRWDIELWKNCVRSRNKFNGKQKQKFKKINSFKYPNYLKLLTWKFDCNVYLLLTLPKFGVW